jgi:hypothetical protein
MIRIEDIDSFKRVASDVSRYASSRTPIESQKCILLEAMDGKLSLSAYDGFRSCKRTMNTDGDLSVLIDAKRFTQVLNNLNCATELSESQNGLRIKSGPVLVTISCRSVHEAAKLNEVTGDPVTVNANELADLLSFGSAVARTESGSLDRAIQIVPSYGILTTNAFIGSSGCGILAHVKSSMFSVLTEKRICLKLESMRSLIATLGEMGTEDTVDVFVDDSQFCCKSPDTEVSIRRLEDYSVGNVPIEKMDKMPGMNSSFMVTGGELHQSLNIMSALSLPEKKNIRIFDDAGNLGIQQVDTEAGSSRHSFEAMCSISDEIFLDMDKLAAGLSCFSRSDGVSARFSSSAIELSVGDKKVMIAGMEG